jgi:hypothetical protein
LTAVVFADNKSKDGSNAAKDGMFMLMRVFFIAPICLTMLLGGCENHRQAQRYVKQYDAAVANRGDQKLQDVTMAWGKFKHSHGIVIPGTSSGHMLVPAPFPERATISWVTSQGERMKREVLVPDPPKKNFYGVLYFNIAADGSVFVTFEEYEDDDDF